MIIAILFAIINIGLTAFVIWVGIRKIKNIEVRVTDLERMVQNVSIEVFHSVALATMPDGKQQKRVTLHGITHAMYKKIMGIKEDKKEPLIHRI